MTKYIRNTIIETKEGKRINVAGGDEYVKQQLKKYGGKVVKVIYSDKEGNLYKENELKGEKNKTQGAIYGKPKKKRKLRKNTIVRTKEGKLINITGSDEYTKQQIKKHGGTVVNEYYTDEQGNKYKKSEIKATPQPAPQTRVLTIDGKTYLLKGGEVYENGRKLNPLKEEDYKKLKRLGFVVSLNKEGKALSNWYWKEKEREARLRGAKAYAVGVAEKINKIYGYDVALVYNRGNKWYVKIQDPIAKQSKIDEILLPNAVKMYKKHFKYASAKIKGNVVEFEPKPIEEPEYYISKYFSDNPIENITVDIEGTKTKVRIKQKHGETTLDELAKKEPNRYEAFLKVYGNTVGELQHTASEMIKRAEKYAPPKHSIKVLPMPLKAPSQIASQASYYKRLAEKYKAGSFYFENQLKWFYAPEAASQKVVNELAKIGHGLNKGISAAEDIVGIDVPFVGTAHDKQQVAALDRKLRTIDQELEYKALAEARQHMATFFDIRKSPLKRAEALATTPTGAALTLWGGNIALSGLTKALPAAKPTVDFAAANAKTFATGGALFTAIEETQKTLAHPKYRPLQDKKAVMREFVAGGTSSVVMANLQLGLMQSLKVMPSGTTAGNIAKRLAAAAGSSYAGGYTYAGTKRLMKGEKISFPEAHRTGLMFAAFGTALEAYGIGVDTGTLPTIEPVKVKYQELTRGETHHYYGIAIRKGMKAQPVIGVHDFKPTIGTPRIDVSRGVYAFETPLTPAEAKILDKPFRDYASRLVKGKFTPQEQKLINAQFKAWAAKYNGKLPQAVRQIDWQNYYAAGLETTRLVWKAEANPQLTLKEVITKSDLFNEKAAKRILDVLKKEKAGVVVFGSMPQKMYLKEYMARAPHDIDIMSFGKPPEALAQEFVKKLKPIYGKNIRVSPERPSLVEIYKQGQWRHAFDIHSYFSDTGAGTQLSTEWVGYGLRTKNPLLTKEGYAIISFGEQGARKGVSSLTPRPFGFMPEAHRLKDLSDLITIGEFAKQELGMKALEQPLQAFKKSIPKAVLEAAGPSGLIAIPYTPHYAYPYTVPSRALAYSLKPPTTAKSGYKLYKPKIKPSAYSLKPYKYKLQYSPQKYRYKPKSLYKINYAYKYKQAYKPALYGYKTKYSYKSTYSYNTPRAYKYAYDYPYKYNYDYRYPYKYTYPYVYVSKRKREPPFPPYKLPRLSHSRRSRPRLLQNLGGRKKPRFRGLLADLLSVQIAQNIFGKATQPRLSRKLWNFELKSTIGFVPTAEMFKTGRPERFRKPKLGLKPLKSLFKLKL